MQPGDLCAFATEKNSAQQFLRVLRIPRFVQGHLVFLFNLKTRMSQTLRELAVIGQKEETLTLGIEPTHVEKPGKLWGQQIENSVPRMRVASRGNEAGWLVQRDRRLLLTTFGLR